MDFEGKRVLVTGAGEADSIGFEITRSFVKEGAEVVITARRPALGERTAIELGKGVRFIEADLTKPEQVRRLALAAGPVDVLVNNAAAGRRLHTFDQDEESFEATFATNVRGPYFLTAEIAAQMRERGGGAIVNVSSISAALAIPTMSAYGASKAAIDALTRYWSAEFAECGIRVNAVSPGHTASRRNLAELTDAEVSAASSGVPLGRFATTREISEAVLFLAGDQASYITGAILFVDGGRCAI